MVYGEPASDLGFRCGTSPFLFRRPETARPTLSLESRPTLSLESMRERLTGVPADTGNRVKAVRPGEPGRHVQRIQRGLRHFQYRSDLIDSCLAETGLTIRPT